MLSSAPFRLSQAPVPYLNLIAACHFPLLRVHFEVSYPPPFPHPLVSATTVNPKHYNMEPVSPPASQCPPFLPPLYPWHQSRTPFHLFNIFLLFLFHLNHDHHISILVLLPRPRPSPPLLFIVLFLSHQLLSSLFFRPFSFLYHFFS